MVRGFAVTVKPAVGFPKSKRTGKGTLPFSQLWFANVRQKAGVRSSNSDKEIACLREAKLAIDCKPDIGGVAIFLAVIFPPANRAKTHGIRRIQRLISTTGTAETDSSTLHGLVDGENDGSDYVEPDMVSKPEHSTNPNNAGTSRAPTFNVL